MLQGNTGTNKTHYLLYKFKEINQQIIFFTIGAKICYTRVATTVSEIFIRKMWRRKQLALQLKSNISFWDRLHFCSTCMWIGRGILMCAGIAGLDTFALWELRHTHLATKMQFRVASLGFINEQPGLNKAQCAALC